MKVHQTFRIDEKVLEEALVIAKDDNRSISNLVETAVIEYVKKKRSEQQYTRVYDRRLPIE